jgi:hypothetical protein
MWRELVPLALSLGAFAMSGFTFYDQYLRREVELWVQVPAVEIALELGRGYFPRVETVLVNKGNVPAIVFALWAEGAVAEEGAAPNCARRGGEPNWRRLNHAASSEWVRPRPLVVKPDEPLALTVDFRTLNAAARARVVDGICLSVGFLGSAGTIERSVLWVRQKLPIDEVTAPPAELRRLRDGAVAIIGPAS